jgi:uncharacterized surface protein with fasciclin (FAS1) repeats
MFVQASSIIGVRFMHRHTFLTVSAAAAALLLGACSPETPSAADQSNPGVVETGSTAPAATAPSGTIVDAAIASPDHTTLVTAVQAAGLAETLSGAGPFTVFAPTNAAFAKLPSGTVERLTQPANREALTKILTYHVVPGRVSASELGARIDAGGGRATLTTVQGGTLTAVREGQSIKLTDAAGGSALVTTADLAGSNGVIHVIDTVVTPPAA